MILRTVGKTSVTDGNCETGTANLKIQINLNV